MALSRNGEIFYKEIFPKLVYDQSLGKYKLNLTAYIPLNLTKRQTKVLERICNKNDIIMEKLPEKISINETEELFTKMKLLKKEINMSLNKEEKIQKEKEYYDIRTKIFESHMYLVYKTLMEIYPDLESSPYKEDIIQSSYEILVHAIDNYNIDLSNQNFRWYLHSYIYKHILRTTTYINNNGYNQDLINIINIREGLYEKGNTPTIQILSSLSGLNESRIKELLTLEEMLKSVSYEELQETEYPEQDFTFDLEEIINRKILREKLVKIIETLLNEQQQKVIKLYCGLDTPNFYKIIEISKMLDLSRQRTNQHKENAIELLSDPIRLKYIKELYEGYTEIELPQTMELSIDETSLVYEKLERKLFKHIPKEELISIIELLDKKYQDVLLVHFELTNNELDSFKDKTHKLNIAPSTYIQRKRDGLYLLRKIFYEKYILNNQNEDINTNLDYLMYNYLNNSKTKTRKKDGTK